MLKYLFAFMLSISPAFANPTLVIDADTGVVLHENDAGAPWMPASLTKMMTAYVTLAAIREGRITHDHAMRVSLKAQKQAPSKMGFKAGSLLTVDNALKIIMVKSANDVSMTLAEGVSGSLESFVAEMNRRAGELGMTGSRFINANGLPGNGQVTTARDMALLAYALLHHFPESRDLWNIPSIQHGNKNIRNTNHLIGRYPGMMGMKTGFICASGFNVVAAAQQNGRTLIAVVFGAHSARERAELAASLMEKHFSARGTGVKVTGLANAGGSPPNIRGEVCVRRGKAVMPVESEDFAPILQTNTSDNSQSAQDFFRQQQNMQAAAPQGLLTAYAPVRSPEPIFTGAKQGGPADIRGPGVAEKKKKPEIKKAEVKKQDPKKIDSKKPEPKKDDKKKKPASKPIEKPKA
jgi:D-alanyl-D-alanine carboxypeptidase